MELPLIDINPDIRVAQTLPADLYYERRWFQVQQQKLWPYTWHAFPGAPGLPIPGDMRPWDLLPGALDLPLLLARGETGSLRALSNVCTHRGNLLVTRPTTAAAIQCRYHGRRFDLEGRCRSMPEFEQTEGFPGPSDHLRAPATEAWGPLVFASLDPEHHFAEWLDPLRQRIDYLPLDRLEHDPHSDRTYEIDANWALYCDNYLEGFHIPYVHPGLRTALDYERYHTELWPYGVLQLGIAPPGESAFNAPKSHPDHGANVAAYYAWLFPTTMLNFYPWGLSANVVVPRDPEHTTVHYGAFVWDDELRGRGAGAALDQVEQEDQQVVLQVQRGVRSPWYERGRYSATQEAGVHHFHRLLARFLNRALLPDDGGESGS